MQRYCYAMNYRLYQPADFAALYAVEELCFEPPFRFSRALMRKLIANPNSATWIAEEDRRENAELAGFAIVDWATVPKGTVAYIQTIEVHPASRRQGIASELLRLIGSLRAQSSAQPPSGCTSTWRMPRPFASMKAAATRARAGKSTSTRAIAPRLFTPNLLQPHRDRSRLL